MSDLFDSEIDSGSKCFRGHPIWLVAEGYGICYGNLDGGPLLWSPWRMTPPRTLGWSKGSIHGRDGQEIPAWFSWASDSKAETLAMIQQDMDAHRALPFDEEAERARLMLV